MRKKENKFIHKDKERFLIRIASIEKVIQKEFIISRKKTFSIPSSNEISNDLYLFQLFAEQQNHSVKIVFLDTPVKFKP